MGAHAIGRRYICMYPRELPSCCRQACFHRACWTKPLGIVIILPTAHPEHGNAATPSTTTKAIVRREGRETHRRHCVGSTQTFCRHVIRTRAGVTTNQFAFTTAGSTRVVVPIPPNITPFRIACIFTATSTTHSYWFGWCCACCSVATRAAVTSRTTSICSLKVPKNLEPILRATQCCCISRRLCDGACILGRCDQLLH